MSVRAASSEIPLRSRRLRALRRGAALVGGAILGCVLASCVPAPEGTRTYLLDPPSGEERYCAWYADAHADVLYFGASAFWATSRAAGGDPRADLRAPGPQLVGRFDLRRERFLPPLVLAPEASAGGIWDVRALGDRIFFTDYFGTSGWVDARSGEVVRLPELGAGLNEIAPGPDGTLLVTRYGEGPSGQGSVLVVGAGGALLAEHPLLPEPGQQVAAKSVAYDPVRREIWVNTDLLPVGGPAGEPAAPAEIAHDVRVLDLEGRERLRFALPEIQFMSFAPDGTGFFAERDGTLLSLRVRPRDRAGWAVLTGMRVPLDGAFPEGLDFVQDIQPTADGGALVMRWSGRLHRVSADGRATEVVLPRDAADLYYTAVGHRDRVCATRCGDVAVVCADAPDEGP